MGVRPGAKTAYTSGGAGHPAQRGVAQLGSALALGARGRRFESGHPDQPRSGRHHLAERPC